MKKLFLFLFLIAFEVSAIAQHFVISGQVTDATSGLPVPNTWVYIADTVYSPFPAGYYKGLQTDANGFYIDTIINGSVAGPNRLFDVFLWDCINNLQLVTVSNNQGSSSSAVANFAICSNNSGICNAGFQYTPTALSALTINFYGSINTSVIYNWDFGDGTSLSGLGLNNPTHTYAQTGAYYVCLTVFDSISGCADVFCDLLFAGSLQPSLCWDLNGNGVCDLLHEDTNSDGLCDSLDCFPNIPCDATFFGFPTNNANEVSFFNISQNPSLNATYLWSFGDGTTSTQIFPTHQYANQGAYYACLTISDSLTGCFDTYCDSVWAGAIHVFNCWDLNGNGVCDLLNEDTNSDGLCDSLDCFPNIPCDATFFGFPGSNANEVSFFNVSPNPGFNASYLWSFGDGATSTQPFPTHQYANQGWYYACLTISDSLTGCFDTYCDSVSAGAIHVFNCWDLNGNGVCDLLHEDTNSDGLCDSLDCFPNIPCDATFFGFPGSNANEVSFFNISQNPSATYLWSFGDGTTSTQIFPTHQYANQGAYYACLTISDSLTGCFDTYCDSVWAGGIHVFNCWDLNGNGVCDLLHEDINNDGTCDTLDCIPNTFCDATFFGFPGSNANEVSFFNILSNPSATYLWSFGDGTTSTQIFPTHQYANQGAYYVCLTISDSLTGCFDTYCDSVWAGGIGTCNAQFGFQPDSINLNGIQFFLNGRPNASAIYNWSFGDGTFSNRINPNHIYASAGGYYVCLTVFDTLNQCTATYCDSVWAGNVTPNFNIDGIVLAGNIQALDGIVYLIKHDALAGTLTAIDTTFITGGGIYSFTNVVPGNYMVKAALGINDPQYMNFLPTYFGDSLFWSGASMITVPTPPIGLHVINLIPGNNPGGPGFIGGLISQGAGIVGMGPIAEMPVLLLDNNWNAVGYAISNNNGNYVLPNLAYGTYIIVMDFWGKQSQHQVVTLSPTTPSIRNVDFEVHSQTITLSSEFSTLENSQILVYPNPATNLININIVNGMQGNYDFKVRDLSGKLLISESVSASQNLIKTLSLEDLSAGVYLLEINNNNGLAKYKIVKTN